MSIAIFFASKQKPRISRASFLRIKNAVLGSGYDLSVAFVDARAMKRLNQKCRRKSSSTDVLSFPLSLTSGEIVFSMKDVAKQAPLFERRPSNFLAFLFIHGLVHLKGYSHGSRMEAQERKFRKKFKI